jgi:hypothetical protein
MQNQPASLLEVFLQPVFLLFFNLSKKGRTAADNTRYLLSISIEKFWIKGNQEIPYLLR